MPYKDLKSAASKKSRDAACQRWKENHPEQYRKIQKNANLRRSFGLTLDQYEQIFKEQKGLCAILSKTRKAFR